MSSGDSSFSNFIYFGWTVHTVILIRRNRILWFLLDSFDCVIAYLCMITAEKNEIVTTYRLICCLVNWLCLNKASVFLQFMPLAVGLSRVDQFSNLSRFQEKSFIRKLSFQPNKLLEGSIIYCSGNFKFQLTDNATLQCSNEKQEFSS